MVANLAEATSHTITPEDFLLHDRQISIAKREKDEAGTEFARVKKAAKSGSMDLAAYKFIEQMRRLEEDEQTIVFRHIIQYMQWLEMPIGTQFSLIDAPKAPSPKAKAKAEHSVWAAGEAGLLAGREGDAASSNPHTPGTEQHVAWAKSFTLGQSERATSAAMEAKDERVADTADATRRAGQGRGRGIAARAAAAGDNARKHLNGNGAPN